jgi:hypothetical protein
MLLIPLIILRLAAQQQPVDRVDDTHRMFDLMQKVFEQEKREALIDGPARKRREAVERAKELRRRLERLTSVLIVYLAQPDGVVDARLERDLRKALDAVQAVR